MTKYNNKITYIHNIRFDSHKEAMHYLYLKDLEDKGEIIKGTLQLQVPFTFIYEGKKIFRYIADFVYQTKDGKEHVIDVKGVRTQLFNLKKKLIEAQYGVEIEIV